MSGKNGFTVIELMVTMAVAAILLAVGVSSYNETITRTRREGFASQLATALASAKDAAKGGSVTVCRSANPGVASATCSDSTDWSTGVLVYRDDNENGLKEAAESVLNIVGKAPSGVTVTIGTNSQRGITFSRKKEASGISTAGALGAVDDIRVCVGSKARVIRVSAAGLITNTEASSCAASSSSSSS